MKLTSYHIMIGLILSFLTIASLWLAYRGYADTKKAVLEYQKQVDDARLSADGRVRLRMSKPEDLLKEISHE